MRLLPLLVVTVLELLGLLVLAAAAGVAGWVHVEPSVGLLAAAVVVLTGAWLMERNLAGRAPKPK